MRPQQNRDRVTPLSRFLCGEESARSGAAGPLASVFQNCLQNPIKHLAVGMAGDNDNRQFGIDFLGRVRDVVGRAIRQFQIEKKQIEMLLVERGQRFLHGADDDSAESDFFQENLQSVLFWEDMAFMRRRST